MNFPKGSKKRKQTAEFEDRSLYASFSQAAGAVSQLYTAAVQQTKRAEEQGARQALERVAQFVVKEYGNAPAVPTAVLMEVLRQELQAAQGSAAAIQLPFPVPLPPLDSEDVHSDDEHAMSEQPTPSSGPFRRSASGHQISPPKHRGGGQAQQLPAVFQQQLSAAQAAQQQMAHMAQMQAAHMAMQQQQQQQQQQHQQQQAGGGFGFPGQQPFQP